MKYQNTLCAVNISIYVILFYINVKLKSRRIPWVTYRLPIKYQKLQYSRVVSNLVNTNSWLTRSSSAVPAPRTILNVKLPG